MRIEIPQQTLSEREKTNIVARGEKVPIGNLHFEIDARYAKILGRMAGKYTQQFRVEEDHIFFGDTLCVSDEYGYDAQGAWVKLIAVQNLATQLARKYADGEIALGENVNDIMQEYEHAYQRIDEIRANNKVIQDEKNRKEEEERSVRDREKADEKDRVEKEKIRERIQRIDWAQEYGSERLKRGLEQGYSCQKLYETELGEYLIDDAGYKYDRGSKVEEKERSCPSLDALNEVSRLNRVEGLSAKVVWLPDGLAELYRVSGEFFEHESPCEAVQANVISTYGYWYKKIE